MKPGQYPFEVLKRVAVGVYNDGFIHAGNLAYLALLSLFPFVIVAAAVARLFGQTEEGLAAVNGLLQTMPHDVADVLRKPIHDVIRPGRAACSGSARWSACGPPAASSRRSATSSAAPMESPSAAPSGNIGSARPASSSPR
jgi:hypothetical protein